jgi:hypothetical protein
MRAVGARWKGRVRVKDDDDGHCSALLIFLGRGRGWLETGKQHAGLAPCQISPGADDQKGLNDNVVFGKPSTLLRRTRRAQIGALVNNKVASNLCAK